LLAVKIFLALVPTLAAWPARARDVDPPRHNAVRWRAVAEPPPCHGLRRVEGADRAPTTQAATAVAHLDQRLKALLKGTP
jgi:hypothetical protein